MTAPDTTAIRALKSKRSKCPDIGNIDLSNVPESHETIWLQWGDNGGDDDTWCADNINDEDVPYIRADLVFALCDEVDRLRRMLDLCGTGPAERYWEGRWRDEAADNERLRNFIVDFSETKFDRIDRRSPDPQDDLDPITDYLAIEAWQDDARAALAQKWGE